MPISKLSEKYEFYYIDVFRVICAIGVFAIHSDPFRDVNVILDYWSTQILSRVCVPFFFITSGFFLQKKIMDKKKVWQYIERLLGMYFFYVLLYLPLYIQQYKIDGKKTGLRILGFMRDFITGNIYYQLWYFSALIIAVILIYLLISYLRLDDRKILIIICILYGIGTMEDAYTTILEASPIIGGGGTDI